ncbi:GlxA family transcriptional regulator [Aureimonas leprariae]|uniref:GlxA family transcriptional regulator n=1 Tax=Plantimonas leprariae TaxID=2615207 RepID=A0A7V7PT50_9HYPH|nr:GlxA family transcriptional regulator [Aureimonas leprariae]KAB0682806.1 GlxA family transcriptional regulator [Aureimonas leprariae]
MSIWSGAGQPLRIDMLLLDDVSLMSISACVEPLRAANRVSGETAYEWRLLSMTGAPVRTSSGILVQVEGRFDPDAARDAVWIVAAFDALAHAGRALLAGLRRLDRRGLPIWGVESGGWVLAAAGVLDGHGATVHWEDLEEFAARFPRLAVKADRFVVDGRYATAGGASPMLDLNLELIRRRQGVAVALEVARIFAYDQVRAPDHPQPQRALGPAALRDPRVAACLNLMAGAIETPLPIPVLARHVGLSTRMLEKLFLRAVGDSPRAFYLDLRLNGARRLVVDTAKSMTEIAVMTGFGSGSALTRAFRARFGQTPRAAREMRLGRIDG